MTTLAMPALDSIQSLTKDLNQAQHQAVTCGMGPVMVLAGAGSGKTKVLTSRIAYLLQTQAIEPYQLLAVTFTNKAAKEMNERLRKLIDLNLSPSQCWIGTFHSIAGRLLRRDIERYTSPTGKQWTQRFVIYDEDQSVGLLKQVVKKLNLDDKIYPPKKQKHAISALKNQGIDAYHSAQRASDFRSERLSQIYLEYEALLAENNALDFDDLLMLSVKLLEQQPEVLAHYHKRFQHILVDEFQDTNDSQYEFIRLLAEGCPVDQRQVANHTTLFQHRSLMVVGDVDQSIYSWRGANYRILLNFQQQFPATQTIKLEHNYRSTGTILEVANTIIENNRERLPKTLVATQGQGEKVFCYEASDDRDEANAISQWLLELTTHHGYKPGDCCILYRTNAQSRAVEDVLMARGMPYTMVGGLRFYERREIRDVVAYLTLLFNPADAYSVKRAINVPKRGIGKASIEALEQAATANNNTLYEQLFYADTLAALRGKATKAVGTFVAVLQTLNRMVAEQPELTLAALIQAVLEQIHYAEAMRVDEPAEADDRLANVAEFINVARQFEDTFTQADPAYGEKPLFERLGDFLTQLSLLSDLDSNEPADGQFLMMTLHAAKGLEWPVVILCGLEENLFPHMRAMGQVAEMEEERRLMYVGVTRARERLYLSYARRRMVFGEYRFGTPSRFLKEAPIHLLTGSFGFDTEPEYGQRNNGYQDTPSRQRFGAYDNDRQFSDEDSPRIYRPEAPQRRVPVSKPDQPSLPKRVVTNGPLPSFSVGDTVSHAKFGQGRIEQVIGSGDKTIYSIQFDGISGKKLIDPRYAPLS